MASPTQKIEDSNNQVSDVKKEMRELKEAQSTSFRKALGNVTPGRSVSVPEKANKSTIAVNIRIIPEEQGKPIDRKNTNLAKVDAILSFLDIEDRKLTKPVQLGKYDLVRTKNWPFLLKPATDISTNLTLKFAHKLKHFSTVDALSSSILNWIVRTKKSTTSTWKHAVNFLTTLTTPLPKRTYLLEIWA